jgi:hypothetical protein
MREKSLQRYKSQVHYSGRAHCMVKECAEIPYFDLKNMVYELTTYLAIRSRMDLSPYN